MRDEGEYAYGARLLHDGGVPYKDDFMQKPPMIIYTYSLAQKISHNVWVPRLLALFSLFFTGLIIADFLRKEYNFKTALVFLGLFSPLISFSKLDGFFAQPEIFLLLPFAIYLWSYFKWKHTQKQYWWMVMGIFGAMSILYKPIIFLAIFFLFLYALLFERINTKVSWKKMFIYGSLFIAGGVFSSLIILLPIILKGGFYYMYESAFLYNRYYAAVMGFHLKSAFPLFSFFWPFLLLCIYFYSKHFKDHVLFLGLFLSCIVGTIGGVMLHYYLLAIPILSIICSVTLVYLGENLKSLKIEKFKNLSIFFMVLVCSFSLIFPFRERFFLSSQDITNWTFSGDDPAEESVIISNELKKITKDTDKVFIFGNQPEILYYAHRKSMTRFVITYPILIKTSLSAKYEKELIDDLQNNPPEVIVSDRMPNLRVLNRIDGYDSYHKFVMNMLVNKYDFIGQTYLEKDSKLYKFGSSFVGNNEWDESNLFLFKKKN